MMETIWPETVSLAEFSPDESISTIQYISHAMNFEGETGWASCGKYIRILCRWTALLLKSTPQQLLKIEQRTSSLVARYINEWLFWQFWTGSSSWVVFISRCFWVMFNSSSWDMLMIYTIYTPYDTVLHRIDSPWMDNELCTVDLFHKFCWTPDGTYICYHMLPTLP